MQTWSRATLSGQMTPSGRKLGHHGDPVCVRECPCENDLLGVFAASQKIYSRVLSSRVRVKRLVRNMKGESCANVLKIL